MAKAQPIEIGEHRFGKKTEALVFTREMLNRYRPGDTVSTTDAEFLIAALRRHPDGPSKIGVGPKRFEVRSADYGTQCFWIIRTDGSEERFSYKKCI